MSGRWGNYYKRTILFILIIFISNPYYLLAEPMDHMNHMMPMQAEPAAKPIKSTPSSIKSVNQNKLTTQIGKEKIFLQKEASKLKMLQPSYRAANLVIAYRWVNFSGKWRRAIAVNNQIPAPTLHFKEGDHVTINVYNHLDQGTSIHWHGILVPWQMDGVVGVSQRPIPPGGAFHYRFTLYQSGTYWYHAHTEAQEQDGLYGAFLIDPPTSSSYHYNKDYVVVLSDWNNMGGLYTFRNLKKEGDYFSPKFPLQPSLMKFIHDYRKADSEERKNLLEDYKMMQQMRMSIYDMSDVAYDAYLLNGKSKFHPWTAFVKKGDVVRLRFIGAAGSTIYQIKIPGAKMEMVHVEGNDVKPYWINHFSIAPGETYDVLVKIKKNIPYIIYAESIDTLGKAYGALITHPNQVVNYKQVAPFPEPLPVTREIMHNQMMAMDHESKKMTHDMTMGYKNSMNQNHAMKMPTEPTIIGDTISPANQSLLEFKTVGTKYQNLVAAVKTNDPNKPVDKVIRMELFGYMDRFIWFVNGLPEYKAQPISLSPGKRYRLIFTNNSMMRHPMHIHGHWFILRNGHADYDPLLHTIEVPPGATAVVDIDTDASGQWFFHCHHLYHMMSGMARVFQYETIVDVAKGSAKPHNYAVQQEYVNRPIVREDEVMPIDPTLVNHPVGHHQGFYLANFLDIGEDPFHNIQEVNFKGLYGGDYNKLELFSKDSEMDKGTIENADIDIFYWRLISQFWAIKAGANYFYRPGGPYLQPGVGIEGLLPYFIDVNLRSYYHEGSVKLDAELSRDTQITNNLFIRLGFRSILATKTVEKNDIGNGLNKLQYTIRPYYRLMPGLDLFTEFEHDQDYGSFKTIEQNSKESTNRNTVTIGLSVLF